MVDASTLDTLDKGQEPVFASARDRGNSLASREVLDDECHTVTDFSSEPADTVAGSSGACKVSRSMKRRIVAKLSSRQVNTLPPIAEAHMPDFEECWRLSSQ